MGRTVTERGVVDPTRQGIAVQPPEQPPLADTPQIAAADAVARVEAWGSSTPRFGLHRISEALAAALSAAIGCHDGDWTACCKYPWTQCCVARLRVLGQTTQAFVAAKRNGEAEP
ncbi:MAG: hypothetical protein AB7H90_01200 [Alphaproteobacteria bacterium]